MKSVIACLLERMDIKTNALVTGTRRTLKASLNALRVFVAGRNALPSGSRKVFLSNLYQIHDNIQLIYVVIKISR